MPSALLSWMPMDLFPRGVMHLRNAACWTTPSAIPDVGAPGRPDRLGPGPVSSALIKVAGKIADVRAAVGRGELHDVDIATGVLQARSGWRTCARTGCRWTCLRQRSPPVPGSRRRRRRSLSSWARTWIPRGAWPKGILGSTAASSGPAIPAGRHLRRRWCTRPRGSAGVLAPGCTRRSFDRGSEARGGVSADARGCRLGGCVAGHEREGRRRYNPSSTRILRSGRRRPMTSSMFSGQDRPEAQPHR